MDEIADLFQVTDGVSAVLRGLNGFLRDCLTSAGGFDYREKFRDRGIADSWRDYHSRPVGWALMWALSVGS